jgi:hypothetical protein
MVSGERQSMQKCNMTSRVMACTQQQQQAACKNMSSFVSAAHTGSRRKETHA